jgi:DNA-binding NtrC family response regulator
LSKRCQRFLWPGTPVALIDAQDEQDEMDAQQPGTAGPTTSAAAMGDCMGHKTSLLIVEDEKILSTCLELHFRDCGMDVAVAGSLAEARSMLAAQDFDAFLLDVGLPDGDGLSLLDLNTVAVERSVVITANPDLGRLAQFGVLHLVPKPIDLDHIEQVVDEIALARSLEPLFS